MSKRPGRAKRLAELVEMVAPRNGDGEDPPVQQDLIPMSTDDLLAAGRELATLVKQKADLGLLHAGERMRMKTERSDLQKQIERIGQMIREQGR